MNKLVLVILLVVLPLYVNSETFYSAPSIVKSLSLGELGLRVKVENMENPNQNCTNNEWYVLEESSPFFDSAYSTLLTSKVAKLSVNFQIIGCVEDGSRLYPRIRHIYFCDTKLCA